MIEHRHCSDCSAPITRQSKTGRCRVCATARINADPAIAARRRAGIRAKFQEPGYRARQARKIYFYHMEARKDPEKRAKFDRNLKLARQRVNDPDVRAKYLAGRAAAGAKRTETVLAWCPPRLRDDYFRLTRSKHLRAAEARRRIEEEITPFERQLHAISQGARLIEKPAALRRFMA